MPSKCLAAWLSDGYIAIEQLQFTCPQFSVPNSPILTDVVKDTDIYGQDVCEFLCCHNHYFPTLETLVECVETQFKTWATPNDTLRTLCAIN